MARRWRAPCTTLPAEAGPAARTSRRVAAAPLWPHPQAGVSSPAHGRAVASDAPMTNAPDRPGRSWSTDCAGGQLPLPQSLLPLWKVRLVPDTALTQKVTLPPP